MPLGPLRETCVQPAPKSRSVVFGLVAYEDQDQKADQSSCGVFVGAALAGKLFVRREASSGS
jgi:hypothetical protein